MANQRIVLITGASYGLGYALALQAAESGAHVIALGRTQGALDDLADAVDKIAPIHHGSITQVPMDITDVGAISYLANSIAERWGKLDLWIHSAWFSAQMQPVAHMSSKDFDKAYNTNIRATAHLIAALDPIIRGGKAVFFNQDGLKNANLANMSASKEAQMTLARAWRDEVANSGTDVQIMTPRPFFSNLRSTLYPGLKRDQFATPADVAKELWAEM